MRLCASFLLEMRKSDQRKNEMRRLLVPRTTIQRQKVDESTVGRADLTTDQQPSIRKDRKVFDDHLFQQGFFAKEASVRGSGLVPTFQIAWRIGIRPCLQSHSLLLETSDRQFFCSIFK